MSKVQNKIYHFKASPSTDVVGYFLYWQEHTLGAPAVFAYDSPTKIDLQIPLEREAADGSGKEYFVDLAAISGLNDIDGPINVAVTAYDEVGNESGFGGAVEGASVDFLAPDAPGEGGINGSSQN